MVLKRLYPPGQRVDHLGDAPDFLRAHGIQSTARNQRGAMNNHCNLGR